MRFPLGPGLASLTLLLQSIAAPTPVTVSSTPTTSASVVVVTQTVTDHVTATDHVTVTDHTTETNVILETAYLVDLPPCYALPTGTGAPLVYQPKPSSGAGSGGNDNNQGSSGSGSSGGNSPSGSISPLSNSNANSPSSNSASIGSSAPNGLTTISNGGNNGGASGTLKTDEGMAGATESAPVLQPVVRPDHDSTDVGHLIPSNNGSYYYTENGTNGRSFLQLQRRSLSNMSLACQIPPSSISLLKSTRPLFTPPSLSPTPRSSPTSHASPMEPPSPSSSPPMTHTSTLPRTGRLANPVFSSSPKPSVARLRTTDNTRTGWSTN